MNRLTLEVLEDRAVPATFTVQNLNDAGAGSLRDAIDQANLTPAVADTINFAPAVAGQTINLSTFFNPPTGDFAGPSGLIVSSPITIQGTGETISRAAGPAFRLFQVTAAGNLTLRNLTLSNGVARGGTGGFGGGGAAGLGGAIYNQGTLAIFGSTLTGNEANGGAGGSTNLGIGGGGGGLGSTTTVSGVNGGGPNGGVLPAMTLPGFGGGGFGGNFGLGTDPSDGGFGGGGGGGFAGFGGGDGGFGAGGGGGGAGSGGVGGAAGGFGGFGAGFGGGNGGAGGGGAGLGGAIFNQGGTVTIGTSTIAGNTARGGTTEGTNGTSGPGQKGGGFGGGVFNMGGTVTLTNVTIAANTVVQGIGSGTANTTDGGAVYNHSGTVTLANSILAGSTGGADLGNAAGATVNGAGPNISATALSNAGTLTGTAITVANPNLGPLQNNGGPFLTMLPAAGSPALDAGSNAAVNAANLGGSPPFLDQRGGNRIFNTTVDLGALEVQPSPPGGFNPFPPAAPPQQPTPQQKTVAITVKKVKGRTQVEVTVNGTPRRFFPFKKFKGRVKIEKLDLNGDGLLDVRATARINRKKKTLEFLSA